LNIELIYLVVFISTKINNVILIPYNINYKKKKKKKKNKKKKKKKKKYLIIKIVQKKK